MSLPLADIRVVDFSQLYAGPATTVMLADLGADVIKVEPPGGDATREFLPIKGTKGLTPAYLALNHNKRGIVLDLAKAEAREVALRLAGWADVAVSNLMVDSAGRLGIAYEDLSPVNPRLVYVSITGFGEKGPDASQPGYDIVMQARSGTMSTGRLNDGSLVATRTPYSEMSTSMLAAYGIMLALRERESTGLGQKVEVNLLHTSLMLQAVQMVNTSRVNPNDALRGTNAPGNCFPCSDGKYMQLNIVAHHWKLFCHGIGMDRLAEDPYDTTDKRRLHAVEVHDMLARHFATAPAAHWDAILKKTGVPANIVQESEDGVFEDPQIVANRMFAQFNQPGVGRVAVVDPPARFPASAAEGHFRRHAPGKGEHTAEVLRELGYGTKEVKALRSAGAVL